MSLQVHSIWQHPGHASHTTTQHPFTSAPHRGLDVVLIDKEALNGAAHLCKVQQDTADSCARKMRAHVKQPEQPRHAAILDESHAIAMVLR